MKRIASSFATVIGLQISAKYGRRHGYRRYNGYVKLSDEQIIEARRLHESQGFSARQLLFRFDLPETESNLIWMRNVLNYSLRSSPTNPRDPSVETKEK